MQAQYRANADEDPLGREGNAASDSGQTSVLPGSVVGIQFEVAAMYTGTLIRDLMMAAERVELLAHQERMTEELHEIFTMQIPIAEGQQAYQGAA